MLKNNVKIKCSPRGERGAVAKAKPRKLFGSFKLKRKLHTFAL